MYKKYRYEHELFEDFLNNLSNNWSVYPETYQWDLLLSNNDNGIQVGIQGKLKANIKVIYQSLELIENVFGGYKEIGPDYIAVLVPSIDSGFKLICNKCGVICLLPKSDFNFILKTTKFKTKCKNRYTLTEISLQSKCGVSSPRSLSNWRISVLKLMIIYNNKGFVTSKDMVNLNLLPSTLTNLYFYNSGERDGKLVKYLLSQDKSPITGYEKEYNLLKEINDESQN